MISGTLLRSASRKGQTTAPEPPAPWTFLVMSVPSGSEDHRDLPADLAGEDVTAGGPPVTARLGHPEVVLRNTVGATTDVGGVQRTGDLDPARKRDRRKSRDRQETFVVPLDARVSRGDLTGGLRQHQLDGLAFRDLVRIHVHHEGEHDGLIVLNGVGSRRPEGGDHLIGTGTEPRPLADLSHADSGQHGKQDQDSHDHQQFDDRETDPNRAMIGRQPGMSVQGAFRMHHWFSGV